MPGPSYPEPLYSGETADPLNRAAASLFGLPYLFPYQRLVIANILEAAEALNIRVSWPWETPGDRPKVFSPQGGNGSRPEGEPFSGGESPGRQIAVLPTGAGKSLCFQMPAMLMDGPTLVIYPLLGLMADQERRLAERGFPAVTLRGGQDGEERAGVWKKIISGESKIIIANPEVLLTPRVLERIKTLGIVHTVIDEAHCVSEWGESFRPAYLETGKIVEAAGSPLVTAFTATAGASVLEKIERYIFGGRGARRITGNPDRKNISYAARGCVLRNLAVRDLLLSKERPAIVFCSSRPGTERLARYLRAALAETGIDWRREIRFYHAGLSREEKKQVEDWFFRGGNGVLISTCAYGLGIDKPDIRTVIHRDCPPSVEAYLQESGRAGRDGYNAEAVLLWGPEDTYAFQRTVTEGGRQRISRLLSYARDTGRCRREALLDLLDYGGGKDSPGARCCDVCAGKARSDLREEDSLAGFFRRNRLSYTASGAAGVLARAENLRWTEEEAGEAIHWLIRTGKLEESGNPFWKGRLRLARAPRLPRGGLSGNAPPECGLKKETGKKFVGQH